MSLVTRAAPDFQAEAVIDGELAEVKLGDYKGKWVVLFFYPLDFTFICPTEIREFNQMREQFADAGAQILAVSTDSVYSHLAWQKHDLGEIGYPMIADMTKRISRDYRVLLENEGVALRGLFIIDPEGTVQYELVHSLSVGRNVAEIYRVLQAIQTGELCPVGWEPGADTLGEA
jgi:alkyl hydroperoxide reductase subunit AhpC